MIDEILVVITMDCERPHDGTVALASGPASWEQSDSFIRGYTAIAAEHGFPVSFFLHPEVALAQAPLFLDLEKDGACIDGLHLHPWKFDDGRFRAHFGGLSVAEQYAALSEASALYQHGLGRRPKYFRPGTFSGNDNTYRILVDLGFMGGSISAPERNFIDINANWMGCPKDPHRPHPHFRQCLGDLPFANMPLTSDFSTTGMLNGRAYFRDLRPDFDDTHEGFARVVDNIIHQVLERAPAVPVISMVTHNDHDYANPDDPICRNYRFILGEIHRICQAAGIKATGATFHRVCDEVLALPVDVPEFVPV